MQYPKVPSRWVVSVSGTCKYRADRSFHHFSTSKCQSNGSSRYLVLASTEEMDHFIHSTPASTELMGRLGIWYLQVRRRRTILSFQYPKVPSRWVVLISGTCEYRTDGSFHHFRTGKYQADWVVSVSGTRKYGADGSFWLLVPSSAEHHFVDAAITTR